MKRLAKVLEEKGLAIDPTHLVVKVSPVPASYFAKYVISVLLRERHRLSTCRLDERTRLVLIKMYRRPPSDVVLLDFEIKNGMGSLSVYFNGQLREYRLDDLSFLLGPARVLSKSTKVLDKVEGSWVPVSAAHLVAPSRISRAKPQMVVKRGDFSWYVYRATKNPVPLNVYFLLNLSSHTGSRS